jgi:hypothetical protein
MSAGKDRYEERRAAEHDADIARIRRDQSRAHGEAIANECTTLLMESLTAFLRGEAKLVIAAELSDRTAVTFQRISSGN